MNPLNFVQLIKQGNNPQQLMLMYLEKEMGNTPMGANLLNLAKNNNTQEIENIARNMAQQKGVDYDTAFRAFKQNLGL